MKEPPDQEKTAPPDGTRGTAMEVSERGEDSISEARRNPEIRSGDTTPAAIVPELADLAARQLLPVEMLVPEHQRRSEPERIQS